MQFQDPLLYSIRQCAYDVQRRRAPRCADAFDRRSPPEELASREGAHAIRPHEIGVSALISVQEHDARMPAAHPLDERPHPKARAAPSRGEVDNDELRSSLKKQASQVICPRNLANGAFHIIIFSLVWCMHKDALNADRSACACPSFAAWY